jgi:prepilin-type processing-associated H-X9-DG protein
VILAGILFPVFAAAREKGRTVKCMNNVKQIGTALLMYAGDNGERVPPFNFIYKSRYDMTTNSPETGTGFTYIKNLEVWRCPSEKRKDATFRYSYLLNGFLQMALPSVRNIPTDSPNWNISKTGMPARLSWFEYPSRTPAFAEELRYEENKKWGRDDNDSWFVCQDPIANRHAGRSSAFFMDGHSKSLDGLDPANKPEEKQWNTARWPEGDFLFAPGYFPWAGWTPQSAATCN